MSQYFPPYRSSGSNIKVELDLSSYAAKTDLKNVTHVDVSSFASKTNLASLKTEVDKIDVDKLKIVLVDLAKLSNVVKNDVVKKTEYNKLVTKVDNIDASGFALKTAYDADKSDLEKKIIDADTTDLVKKKTDFNSKISGLATTSALTAVENNLVKKIDYNTKISDIKKKITDHNHDKYITTPEINRLTTENFKARLAQANLISNSDLGTELKKNCDRVTSNKTKHLLVENELEKLKTFDAAYFRGKSHFEEDGTQNYLVFQPMPRYFKKITGVGSGNYIYFWKSKGLSDERLDVNTASNYSITPELSFYRTKTRVEFNGRCLKQDKVTYNHETIVNVYIVYEISINYNIRSYRTLENCLFGAVSLTKNADIDRYKYYRYGIGFDRHGEFSFGNSYGGNCIILGADMSSSSHANNRKNNILALGKDFVQGISGTTIYAKILHKFNFTENNKKFCLSLHYNGANSYLFLNGTEIHKFIAKDSEIVATPLCLGNISKDFSVGNMKKQN